MKVYFLTFFIFSLSQISFLKRYGLTDKHFSKLYGRGRNFNFQCGIDNGSNEVDYDFPITQTEHPSLPIYGKTYKFICSAFYNLVAVTSDNKIWMLGKGQYVDGNYQGDYTNFVEIDNKNLGGSEIIDLQCGSVFFMIQTDDGHIWGFGSNTDVNILSVTVNQYETVLEPISMMSKDLEGKKVRTFGIGGKWGDPGMVAIDTLGKVYFKGAEIAGRCTTNGGHIPDWTVCNEGYFKYLTYGDLKINTITGGYETFYYISDSGEVYFHGNLLFSGLGDHYNGFVYENVIRMNFSSAIQNETLSQLHDKKVIDIKCTSDSGTDICIALTTEHKIYSWTYLFYQGILGRPVNQDEGVSIEIKTDHLCKHPFYISDIFSGNDYLACKCSNNILYAWGSNANKRLVNNNERWIWEPTEVAKTGSALKSTVDKYVVNGYGHAFYFVENHISKVGELILYVSIGVSSVVFVFFVVIIVSFVLLFVIWKLRSNKLKESKLKEKELDEIIDKKEKYNKEELELFRRIFVSDDNFENTKKRWFEKNEGLENLFVEYGEIKFLSFLGSGGSGCNVFKVLISEKEYAFKSFPLKLESQHDDFSVFQKEMSVLMKMKHKNILNCEGVVFQKKNCGLVIEYCNDGDLGDFIKRNDSFSMENRLKILFGIAKGMNYLHNECVLHRDLKPGNVLISRDKNSEYVPKIMDFGLSRTMTNSFTAMTMNIGTGFYRAPELIVGSGKYSRKIDVYAFSVLCYVVLTGDFNPFNEGKDMEENLFIKIANEKEFRPDIAKIKGGDENDCQWIKDLITKCWDFVPNNRLHFFQICALFQKNMKCFKDVEICTTPPPITIYIKTKDMSIDEALDHEMKNFTMLELHSICQKTWKDQEVLTFNAINSNGAHINSLEHDHDLYSLHSDTIIQITFKKT